MGASLTHVLAGMIDRGCLWIAGMQELALPSIQHGGVHADAGQPVKPEQIVGGAAVQGG